MPAINFADYHRTIIAFHGTNAEAAERLVAGDHFQPSDQDNEWFGKGVYFWEHAFQQAWWWAERSCKRTKVQPAVVGAVIRLGYCFDLLDQLNVKTLRGFYEELVQNEQANGGDLPVNVRSHRRLDCAVFNYLYNALVVAGTPLDTIRAVFVPTSGKARVYKGSWISEETHIQICVRNPASILAVWNVRRDGRYGKEAGTSAGAV